MRFYYGVEEFNTHANVYNYISMNNYLYAVFRHLVSFKQTFTDFYKSIEYLFIFRCFIYSTSMEHKNIRRYYALITINYCCTSEKKITIIIVNYKRILIKRILIGVRVTKIYYVLLRCYE